MPSASHTVTVKIEFDPDTISTLRHLIREEITRHAADALTAAVDLRDGTGPWHRGQAAAAAETLQNLRKDHNA